MRLRLWRAFVAATLALGAPVVSAMEGIADYASEVAIQRDGGLLVIETITVRAEGDRIKRGIYRDFPTRYQNRNGARVIVPFEVVNVLRDGQSEPYSLEHLSNGVRVRIGRAEHLLEHGMHEYRIAYRTARQVGFFDKRDELYWNVTGNGWDFVIARASARVRLPQQVSDDRLSAEVYSGPQGARGHDATARIANGEFLYETTRALGPHEGLTIVAMFPKGVIAAPTDADRIGWLIEDNAGALVGAAGVGAVLVFLFLMWWAIGRDPESGPPFPRYEPPAGMSPAAVRFVDKMAFDNACFAAALLGLGARGFLKVKQDGDAFVLTKTGAGVDWLEGDKPMADALFAARTEAKLTKAYDPSVARAQSALKGALRSHYKGALFRLNSWPMWLAVIGAALALLLAGNIGAQPVALIVLVVILVVALIVFGRLMPAYTREGRRVQDQIDGLRQYLGVAERDDLARMKAPEATPAEFARMLPYALALGVEKTWADRFAAVLGSAAVAAAVSSYYSGNFDSWSSNSGAGLAKSLGSLGDTVSSASTAPSSSSGGGGGGSSGGGGGGGGGGGW